MLRVQIVPSTLPIMVQVVPSSVLMLLLSQTRLPMIIVCFQGVISLTVVIVPCGMTIAETRENRCKPTTVESFLNLPNNFPRAIGGNVNRRGQSCHSHISSESFPGFRFLLADINSGH